jgi:hypothetical protein
MRTFRRGLGRGDEVGSYIYGRRKIGFNECSWKKREIPTANSGDVNDVSRNWMLAAGMRSRHGRGLAILSHLLAAVVFFSCHLAIRHDAGHNRHCDHCEDQNNGSELKEFSQHHYFTVHRQFITPEAASLGRLQLLWVQCFCSAAFAISSWSAASASASFACFKSKSAQ